MNRTGFIRRVSEVLRENNIKKPVHIPKQTLHISDDDGHSKDFYIKSTDKKVIFTRDDVAAIIDTCIFVIEESLKQGEPITIHGFGSLGLNYRKPRSTKLIGTDEKIQVDGRYVPKFSFGNDLRMCARIYELSLKDRFSDVMENGELVDYGD